MFLLMISCFLVCWTPYAVVSMMVAFGRKSMVSPTVAIIPSFFAKSSTAYNPLIYVFMSIKVGNRVFRNFYKLSLCVGTNLYSGMRAPQMLWYHYD